MALFLAMGGSGGGATIALTFSSEFYGQTITATNGTKTVTKVAPSTGTMDITVPESGTWVVSATIDGQTYSTTVTVDLEYTATLEAIPDGSTVTPTDDIQTWLRCAGITDKTTYTTLSDVLGDTETLIALCADSNACDYMVRSTNWASGVAADSTAMLIVGKYNYCANKLLGDSTWSEALVNSTYWAYVFDVTVPKMTSNSAPSGLAFASSTYDSNYPAYKAFNGDSSNGWNARANPVFPEYLGYIFTQKIRLSEIALDTGGTRRVYTFKIQGSNDTTNGTDGTWADVSEVITTPDSGYNKTYPINGDGEYKAYRLYIVTGTTVTGNLNIATLQFYGRTDNANYIPLVPKMTSNTTPSGECSASTTYGTGYEAYRAFDGDSTTRCAPYNTSNVSVDHYVAYEFENPCIVDKAVVTIGGTNTPSRTYKFQGYNGTSWVDVSESFTNASGTFEHIIDTQGIAYQGYRIFYPNCILWVQGSYSVDITELQFYRESDLPIIHSAVEDNIFYMDDGSPVALCGIPVGDTIDVDLEAYKGQTLTLVSTVAKDPTNLSNDFSMNVRITPNITEIYLMPIKSLYWWGSQYNLQIANVGNGWAKIGGRDWNNPTFNKQDIYCNSDASHNICVGNELYCDISKFHTILKSTTLTSGSGMRCGISQSKDFTSAASTDYSAQTTQNTVEAFTKELSGHYLLAGALSARGGNIYAVWYE